MIIGIDLGTTNSLVSYWADGQAHLIPNALGQLITPSVVSLNDDDTLLVGQTAQERLITHPSHTVASFKRLMGTQKKLSLGAKEFTAEELSSFVLRALKEDAEAFLKQPITEAVITVPAYFNDGQRKATYAAGSLAGLQVKRVLNEPTAAALAYGLHHHEDHNDGKIIVLDLGGGTFDVSIIDVFDGIMEVRASAGDNFLGGNDFDTAIIRWFATQTDINLPDLLEPSTDAENTLGRLRVAAEKARRTLDTEETALIDVDLNTLRFSAPLTRDIFRQIVEPLLTRMTTPLRRALNDTHLDLQSVGSLVLAGGATRMPIVRQLAATLLKRFPLHHINADHVVALGAAVQAGLVMRDAALEDIVLTDVAPYTLGIAVAHSYDGKTTEADFMSPIIDRNSSVPVSRTQRFYPVRDYQKKIHLRIFQGEHRLVKENVPLGDFTFPLPQGTINEQAFDVCFTYTINGLLEVITRPHKGGETRRLVIEQQSGSLSAEDIEQRLSELAELKIPPRDQAKNRQLLARAERLYMDYTGQQRHEIGRMITYFEEALNGHDYERLEELIPQVEDILEQLDYRDPFE